MENLIELLQNNKELRKQARQLMALAVSEMAEKRTNVKFDDWFNENVRDGKEDDAGENTLPIPRVGDLLLEVALMNEQKLGDTFIDWKELSPEKQWQRIDAMLHEIGLKVVRQ